MARLKLPPRAVSMADNRPLPRISIVTPSYNQADYLPDTMQSVLGQNYPNLEYIVMDGGSTDGSREIIEAHADQLAYWQSEKDGGQAAAIAAGMARTTGEIMAYLNSDDVLAPGSLEFVADYFAKHPHVDAIYSHRVFIDERNVVLRYWYLPPHSNKLIERWDYIPQETCFWRRSAWEKAGNIDASYRFAMDYEFFVRMMRKGSKFVRVPRFLGAFREHSSSKTTTQFDTIGREEVGRVYKEYKIGFMPTWLRMGVSYHIQKKSREFADSQRLLPGAWRGTGYLYTEPHTDAFHEARKAAARIQLESRDLPKMEPFSSPYDQGIDHISHQRLILAVDLNHISLGESGGIVQLLKGVLETAFAQYKDATFHIFTTPYNHDLIHTLDRHRLPLANVVAHALPVKGYYDLLTRKLHELDVDVLLRAYPALENPDFPPERQIVLIPDIQHEQLPKLFDFRTRAIRRVSFNRVVCRAGAIATISEFSRAAIRNYPGNFCHDIFLMPPALQFEDKQYALTSDDAARLPNQPFFLFPANIWNHKNHRRVLEAFGRFLEKSDKKYTLVLTGHPHGWPELRRDFPQLPVVHLGFVSQSLLHALYRRAHGLLYFSLYEGFGMPLLEAFDAGLPVACSSTTSLPEIGADAAVTADPENIDAMAAAIQRLATDDALRAELIARGRAQLARFSWSQSAASLIAAANRLKLAAGRFDPPRRQDMPVARDALPLVSIITPSYNQAAFLGRTLQSVERQTYSRIEHIVKDGSSTDHSRDILEAYGDRIRWVSEPDNGQTHAINKGLAEAHGEILCYLNSDDVLMPDAIERVVAFMTAHPEIDIVYGQAQYTDAYDDITDIYKTTPFSIVNLARDCGICQPATFWRRRVYEELGPFDESLNYVMDYEYWLRAAFAGKHFACMPLVLAQSRLHADTKTLSARGKIYREVFKVLRRHAHRISYSYAHGFVNHLTRERWPTIGKILQPLRYGTPGLALVLFGWFNRGSLLTAHNLQSTMMGLLLALNRKNALVKKILRMFLRIKRFDFGRNRRVFGFDDSGNLHIRAGVHAPVLPKGGTGYIEGIALAEGTLRAHFGTQVVAEVPLYVGQPVRIAFPIPNPAREHLEIDYHPNIHTRFMPAQNVVTIHGTNLVNLSNLYG